MAALGFETSAGDFEVVDLCFAGLPDIYTPQAEGGKGKAKAENGEAGELAVIGAFVDGS